MGSIVAVASQKTKPSNNPELSSAIGFRIKAARKSLKMTQAQLSKAIGCSAAPISNIESGIAFPAMNRIPALCTVLGMTPNELFGWEEPR